jgi:hypothetical protein
LPPGTQPPLVINFSASSVPILQLGLSGQGIRSRNSTTWASTSCEGSW